MGELSADTAVDGTDGVYSARLSSDWEIWGPNGGYVASVAMRAGAGRELLLSTREIDGLDGLEHDHARMPELPSPHELRPIEELTPEPRSSRYSFFGNVDERPTEWIDDWEHRKPGEPGAMSSGNGRLLASGGEQMLCRRQ